MNLEDYRIWELRKLGEDSKNYTLLEELCCKNSVTVRCQMEWDWINREPNYGANVEDMAEALVDIKEDQMRASGKQHSLFCDEYHQHWAPKCCGASCWCQEEYREKK